MKNKIIASVLAIAFAFSMVGSAEAATFGELQAQITQLLQMIIQLQARLAALTNTTTQQPITTTTITAISSSCGQEGEKLNRNPFFGATDRVCCSGLTDIRESKSYSICTNCGDKICKYPENSTNCPTDCQSIVPVLPQCQWCGKACIRVYPWMACPNIAPPQGYICTEINGKCTSAFGIPTTTTTKQPITTTTTIPASLPDLTISNITADRTTLYIGETTKISATERNIGNKSAGYHNTGIFEDNIETPLSSMEINTIAPGYGAIINANYTCFRAGSHTITVLADFIHRVSTGEVVESNENNNSKTITINCITSPISTTTTAPSTAYIKVISPNGGEQLVGGQTYNITWQSNGVNNVKLAECAETPLLPTKYTCQELSGIPNVGISATLGKLSWYVDPNDPFIPGRVKIKIWDVNNSSIYDQSDNYFSIVSFANPKINLVIDPSSIYEGQSTTIIWNVIPVDNISYCRASGGSGDWWGIKAVSGREIIRPIRSRYQDYVLTCIDRDGQSTSASAGVAFLSTTTSNH